MFDTPATVTMPEGSMNGLPETAPGPDLGRMMDVDPATLTNLDLVHLIHAAGRQISHYQSRFYSTVAELAARDEIGPDSGVPSEIAAALRLTRYASECEYWLSLELARHPEIDAMLREGRIDLRRAKVLLEHIQRVAPDHREALLDALLPSAPDLTTGQLRARLRRLVAMADPEAAERRYRAGLEDRRVVVEDNSDGTANLLLMCSDPVTVCAARARIEEMARKLHGGDQRTIDQLRADVALDLLNGGSGAGDGRAVVDIVVDLATLVGLTETPGEIPGFGPVIAEVARKTVLGQTDAPWEFTVTDQGQPVATGTVSRRPTRGMGRQIRARYATCAHPGCRQSARRSDIDHTRPWSEGGPTHVLNLVPLCRYHHRLRDRGWNYVHSRDGSVVWTSPTGHTYRTARPP